MKQLFLPDEVPSRLKKITGKNYHYLVHVLRSTPGDKIRLIFNSNNIFQAVITHISQTACSIQLEESIPKPGDGPEIILVQGLPKGKKMDQIIRQATECGVSAIIPLETEYSIVKINNNNVSVKIERWERIIKEALQQSGSKIITRVFHPIGINKLPIVEEKKSIGLFFHQKMLETNSLHGYLSTHPKKIYLCIGAEGGFSPTETGMFSAVGYHPVYLGDQTLRSETAAVYALGAVKTQLQEIHSWTRAL